MASPVLPAKLAAWPMEAGWGWRPSPRHPQPPRKERRRTEPGAGQGLLRSLVWGADTGAGTWSGEGQLARLPAGQEGQAAAGVSPVSRAHSEVGPLRPGREL